MITNGDPERRIFLSLHTNNGLLYHENRTYLFCFEYKSQIRMVQDPNLDLLNVNDRLTVIVSTRQRRDCITITFR